MAEHDTAYKQLFSQPRLVKHLFAEFVDPGITKQLNFRTLSRCNASYVSDDLRERQDDIIWRVRTRGKRGKWVYVYLLLEFQSTVDPWMPVRIMTYKGLLYQDLIKQKQVKAGQKLPVVFPLVLYNGLEAWKAARSLDELVETVPGQLKQYRVSEHFALIEERAIDEEDLAPGSNLVRLLFRLEQCKAVEEIQQILEDFWPYIARKDLVQEQKAFAAWIGRVLLQDKPAGKDRTESLTLQEAKSMLAERARTWFQRAERRGMRRGREKGQEEQRAEIARRMANRGMKAEAISDLTGLPVAEVRRLLKSIEES